MPVRAIRVAALLSSFVVSPLIAQSASLSLVKVDSPDPVAAGATLVYTLTVSSEGPDAAANAVLTDPLPTQTTFVSVAAPAGWTCAAPAVGVNGTVTCSMPAFPPGSAVFTVTVTVDPSTPVATVITNTATVASDTPDPHLDDNSASADTTVAAQPVTAVSIAKTDSPDPVLNDADLTYTLTANSNVARATDGATVTDTLPVGTTFVSLAAPAGWSCTAPSLGGSGTVTCTVAPFPQGDATFTLVLHVEPSVAGGTVLANTAQLDVDDSGRTGSASGTATTQVLSPSSLTATKAVGGRFQPGGTVTYTVVLTNSGTHAQGDNPGPELTDTLPPELTLVSAAATSGTAATAGNTVTWNGALAAGATVTLTIQATVNPVADGTAVRNQAAFFYDADGNGTNEATGTSDDPATDFSIIDATVFVVRLPVVEVPTLGVGGLLALAGALALGGWRRLREGAR